MYCGKIESFFDNAFVLQILAGNTCYTNFNAVIKTRQQRHYDSTVRPLLSKNINASECCEVTSNFCDCS